MPAQVVSEQDVYDHDVLVFSHVFVPAGTKLSDVFFPRLVVAGDLDAMGGLAIRCVVDLVRAVEEDRAEPVQD